MTAAAHAAWRRLDRRMLLIHPIQEIPRALPALLAAFIAGNGGASGLIWIAAALVITLGLAFSRWFTTRYRVTEDRVEVGSGLFRRRVRAVSRDRIRTVDVTARAMHRLLGLARVEIGTGRSDREEGGGVRLDGLTAAQALALRGELLHRPGPAPMPDASAAQGAPTAAPAASAAPGAPTAPPAASAAPGAPPASHAAEPETELARLDPTWVRFAPFTLSGVISVGVVLGFLLNVANEAHFDPKNWGPARHLADRLGHAPVALTALALLALAIVAVVVASTVGYALAFWDFRLTRHPRGTLHVARGLITTRATTIDERRLHGIEVSEPLLLRMVAGARLIAVATGLRVGRGAERGGSLLVPPAPREEVERVAAEVIGAAEPVMCPVTAHGPRARTRRYTRALTVWALLVAALAVVHWAIGAPWWLPVAALALLPIAVALAADRYRNLGHAVAGGRLVAAHGSLLRRRVAVAADGIIGCNVERSFFQRRAGLATLTATTAAGEQHYDVQDVEIAEALGVAELLLPGLLTPFLERSG